MADVAAAFPDYQFVVAGAPSIEPSLYDRYLDIGSIKIQTAGKHMSSGSMYEGSLSGLVNYDELHVELRDKVKTLHPSSGPLATGDTEKKSGGDVMLEILKELKDINKNLSVK